MGVALANLLINIITLYTIIVFAWVISSWLVSFGIINLRNPTSRSIVSGLERLVQPAMLYFLQDWIGQIARGNFL